MTNYKNELSVDMLQNIGAKSDNDSGIKGARLWFFLRFCLCNLIRL